MRHEELGRLWGWGAIGMCVLLFRHEAHVGVLNGVLGLFQTRELNGGDRIPMSEVSFEGDKLQVLPAAHHGST